MFKKITAVFLLVTAQLAFAQSGTTSKEDSLKTYNLSEIVVTATRLTTPEIEIASSVTVLNEKEIQKSNKNSIVDLLRDIPGLSISRSGGPGAKASIFVRGANSNQTLVLVDGISMNDPSSPNNGFDFTNLQTSNIERIEILRGPQSTLYGSDAIGGVISIFTKKGSGSPKFSALTEVGSYNTFRANAIANGSYQFVDYSLSFSRFNSLGFSAADEKYGNYERDGIKSNSILSRLGFRINDYINLDMNFNYQKSKADIDQNSIKGDDPNFISDIEESTFKTALNTRLIEGLWYSTVSLASLRHIGHLIDDPDSINKYYSLADFDGTKYRIEWQNNFHVSNENTVILGTDYTREKTNTYFESNQYGLYTSSFPSKGSPIPEANTIGIFLQDQFALFNRLYGTLGIRYDRHNKYGVNMTFRIAPAYLINETGTKLKATVGTGFRSPSLYDLFDPTYGNPELKPEKSSGWDAGVEQYLLNNKIVIGATYFFNNFTDLLVFKNSKTRNINSAETMGVEITAKALIFNGLNADASYTYSLAKDKSTDSNENGLDLVQRPRNKFCINLGYHFENSGFNLEILNIGKRFDYDYDPVTYLKSRILLSSYTLVNFAATYEIDKYFTFFGRVDNLFDAEYEEVLYYGTPKRSVYAGVKLTF